MQNATTPGNRSFDIVVWGASGFTGRLVVEYLSRLYPQNSGLRWAVAGRNQQKVATMLDEIVIDGTPPPIIIADSHDRDSIDRLARATRVVLTTVGPYARHGDELVAACVRNGTHYCDLCGEVHWMRSVIDRHQAEAVASGAKIVMSCGFDSIPSDFGVWFLQREATRLHGRPCNAITLLVKAMQGGASGGTFASMLNAIDAAMRDKEIAGVLRDPYALNPESMRRGPDGPDQSAPEFNAAAGAWTAPFIMGSVNTRVVRRTIALTAPDDSPSDFHYREAVLTGAGFVGRIKATIYSYGLRIFLTASAVPFTRKWIVEKLLPRPGQGPSKRARETGFFNLLLIGEFSANGDALHTAENERALASDSMRVRVTGDRDPGYGSTSKMLAECAICLALDTHAVGGGCWTPVSAMGDRLFRRLTTNAGLSFVVES